MLWRGVGGEPGQDGDLYRWRAPDGREVLLHHLSPDGYEAGSALPADAGRLEGAWARLKEQLEPRARSPHVAVFVGADHHAAHPAVGPLRELLAAVEPGAEFRVSRLEEYFEAAGASAAELPVLEGELRWSYGYTWTLQGVHATRAPLKRRHAEAELGLERMAEPLVALALAHRGRDARPLLDRAWRTLLRSQFHDSIGGCSSDAVADRVTARIGDAASMAGELARASLDVLIENDPDVAREYPGRARPRLVLFNPAARRRGGVVVAELSWFRRDVLVGPPGGRQPRRADPPSEADISAALEGVPHQVLSRRPGSERLDAPRHYPDQDEVELVRVALALPELPGFALSEADPDSILSGDAVTVGPRGIANEWLRVSFDGDGLLQVTDRRGGRQIRPPARAGIRDRRRGYVQLRAAAEHATIVRGMDFRQDDRLGAAGGRARGAGGAPLRRRERDAGGRAVRRQSDSPVHDHPRQPRDRSPAASSHSGRARRDGVGSRRPLRPGAALAAFVRRRPVSRGRRR